MIKSTEFNTVFQEFDKLLKEVGFKRIKPRCYQSSDNIQLQIILDKWGWSEEDGLQFVVRLNNLKLQDENGNYPYADSQKDVTLKILGDNGYIKPKFLNRAIKQSNLKTVGSFGWYSAYDDKDLRKKLEFIMPAVIGYTQQWREEQKKVDIKKISKRSVDVDAWKNIQNNLDKLFPSE